MAAPEDYDDEWNENWDGTGSVTRSDPFDDDEWAEAWAYTAEGYDRPRPSTHWDHEAHKWICTCNKFVAKGICYHVCRFRPEIVVKADEKYL